MPAEDSVGHVHVPEELRRWFPNPARSLIQRAVERSVFEGREATLQGEPPLRPPGQKLLRKKVVRARRKNGQYFSLTGKRRSEEEERK